MTHHLLAAILNLPCKISKKFWWGSKERMSMSRFIAQRVINEYFFDLKNIIFYKKIRKKLVIFLETGPDYILRQYDDTIRKLRFWAIKNTT